MANFPLRQTFIVLSVGLAVAGCNDDRIHNICGNHPELCQDLVTMAGVATSVPM